MIKMRNYKIAATVRHSGKYIECTTAAMNIKDAIVFFENFIDGVRHVSMDAISELDITETGESE
jgi:TATA-box binding protein (TBP) (component of TFIID and TFIIIB)